MPFQVECPVCGARLNAPDQFEGRRVKCKCGSVFTASAAKGPPAPTTTPDAPKSTQATQEEQKPSRRFDLSFLPDGLRETLLGAIRAILFPTIAGCCLMVALLAVGAPAILAAEDLIKVEFRAAWPSASVGSILGIAYGFSVGYRISDKAGLTGWLGCAVGLAAVALLLATAYVGGVVFLGAPLPSVLNLSLFCLTFFCLLGVSYYTLWTQ